MINIFNGLTPIIAHELRVVAPPRSVRNQISVPSLCIDFQSSYGQYIATFNRKENPMHFRDRGHVVQLIRTSYDKDSKKGKNQIVGRLVKANPRVPDALEAALTAEERQEVASWLEGHAALERLKRELAVRTLPEQLALAREWFRDQSGDDARIIAATLIPAWVQLRVALKRKGFVD
jgi:hypothetical protein